MNANKGGSALKDLVLLSENLFTAFYKMVQAIRIHRNNNPCLSGCCTYLAFPLEWISDGRYSTWKNSR